MRKAEEYFTRMIRYKEDTYAILSPRNCRDVRMHNITEMIQFGLPSEVYATCTAVHVAALCTCKS